MFDPVTFFGFLAHFGLFTLLFCYICHAWWTLPKQDWPPVVAVLLWVALVFTAHIASAPQKLNDLGFYIASSFLGFGLTVWFANSAAKTGASAPLLQKPELDFDVIPSPKVARYLKWFLIGTFAFAALGTLAIGLLIYPDNADSMIYRLPRTFWYVGGGSLLHPFDSIDKRMTFYPLDGVSLYFPFVLYALPGMAHALPSLASWFLIVFIVYRFARDLGARRLIAFFAAWMVGLTPSILAQATSTNDEILAATAVLLSLFMGFRWLLTGKRLYFFLAATSIGLSAGTKGHLLFLTPTILLAFGLLALAIRKEPKRLKLWTEAIGLKLFALSLLSIALMVLPFLFYNYASSGRFYFFDDFKGEVLNLSASFQAVFQNLLIYLSQMIFSPVADLNFYPDATLRQSFNTALNNALDPFIAPFIDPNPALYHLSYRYVGITLPVSVRFVEFSLWSGFVWLLWPFQAALAAKARFSLNRLFALIALLPPIWLLTWSILTLYMEGTATYFTYYLICGAPASVFLFRAIASRRKNELRWIIVGFVALSSFIISHNLLMYSGFRALPDLLYARSLPFDWVLVEPDIIKEIRQAKRIRIIQSHEKMPYFAYMHWNPKAKYENPYPNATLKDPHEILQLYPVSSLYHYSFFPVKIKGKETKGMTYLGVVRGIGKEVIFATGNGVEARHPKESDYLILRMAIMPEWDKWLFHLAISPEIPGYSPDDHLEFSYELKRFDQSVFFRDYSADPLFRVDIKESPNEIPFYLTIKVRSAWNHKIVGEATYRIAGKGGWLTDYEDY